jgi:hypothetical protein
VPASAEAVDARCDGLEYVPESADVVDGLGVGLACVPVSGDAVEFASRSAALVEDLE